ncbi:MAG: sugar phosphate isomerase/epimerase [Bacteroidales bacterium]
MSRRHFAGLALAGSATVLSMKLRGMTRNSVSMSGAVRLGGPLFDKYDEPGEWIALLKRKGYSAAYCPVGTGTDAATIRAYEKAASEANIRISEVGAWSNPLSRDAKERSEALKKCKESLYLAEQIGAGCAVNITGSRGAQWDGPDAENFSKETFDMIVQVSREIIDEVNPTRTFYTLETMPWAIPDSPDSYLELIKAIDRKQLGVHLDPVNMINSPRRYYANGDFIRECFRKLGPWIKNCHGKDILLQGKLTVHLDEVIPGTGGLDYKVFLSELSKLKDVPLMLEHLEKAEEYDLAATNVRRIGKDTGIEFL